eukprot:3696472-Prymnesium_polylepis.1
MARRTSAARQRACCVIVLLVPVAVVLYAWLASSDQETLYDMLGVASDASAVNIKRAYHQLAKRLHPDKVRDSALKEDAEARFRRVAAAHETLIDPSKRKLYDATLQGLNPTLSDPQPAAEEEARAYPDDVRPPDDPPPPTLLERAHAWMRESEEARWLGRGCVGFA